MFPSVGDCGSRETPQEVSRGENPAAVKVISLPIPLPAELSENVTMNGAVAESVGTPELPVTVIVYGPAVVYATKKLPFTLPEGVTVQVALAPTGAPETEQAISEPENPEPEKVTRNPAPPQGTLRTEPPKQVLTPVSVVIDGTVT